MFRKIKDKVMGFVADNITTLSYVVTGLAGLGTIAIYVYLYLLVEGKVGNKKDKK